MTIPASELRQQWDECLRLLDRDRVRERQVQSTDYYNAQGRMVSLLWANAAEIIDALERDQDAEQPKPLPAAMVDLTAMLERGLRDYKAIDSTDPSGVSHLGLDDADYLALAARLAEVVIDHDHWESGWEGHAHKVEAERDAAREAGRRVVRLLRELVECPQPSSDYDRAFNETRAYLASRKEQTHA